MKGNDIRESYLSFFENKKDHLRLKSFSLIPKDDPSLLLIGAGMAPLIPHKTLFPQARLTRRDIESQQARSASALVISKM